MTVRRPVEKEAPSPSGRLLHILGPLERVGLDPDQLLAEAGLAGMKALAQRGGETLSLSQCTAIARAATTAVEAEAARRSGTPPPYAHLHDLIWHAASGCQTMSNVIGQLQAYSQMLGGAAGVGNFRIEADELILPLSSLRSAHDPVNLLADLFSAVGTRNMLAWLTGEPLRLSRVEAPYPAALAAHLPGGFVDCAIVWDSPRLAIGIPAGLLHCPVVRTTSDLIALLPLAPLMLEDARRTGAFAFAVGRLFDQAISLGRPIPCGEEVAARLGCSPATLRRRLTEEGASLQSIKNNRRKDWAVTLLRQDPIPEVASRIGFSDETAFRRALRQWTGRTPSSFRAEGAVPAGR